MSLEVKIKDVLTRVATEMNTIKSAQGNMSSLSTTAKSDLVGAINEVNLALASATGINDTTSNTASSWSSQKTASEISTARSEVKAEILGGAGPAFDSLLEIQTVVEGNDTDLTALLITLAERVSTNPNQGLSTAQKLNARTNIDVYSKDEIGNPETNFVSVFEGALS